MIGKNKESKQPKAVRHDQAKEKCKIYQRSLSSHLRAQSKELVPIPGQFALQTGPTFTTNIKAIMREPHPQSASRLLSHHSSRKNSTYKTNHLNRINSEVILKDNVMADSATNKTSDIAAKKDAEAKSGQNKNSYLVKSRSQVPKFSQGYRIVKLDNPPSKSKLNATKQYSTVCKQQPSSPQKIQQTLFLPVEYYLTEDERPANLMNKFKIGNSDYVLGFSRWYDLEGKSSWKKCRVLRYIEENGRWQIQWLHNGKQKEISRINLYFEGQNRNIFEMRVATAEKYRKLSEVYLRYNIQIDEMQTPTHQLSGKEYQRIVSLIGDNRMHNKSAGLFLQVNRLYIRSNHQAEFNATLPFNKSRRKQFEDYLPKYLFKPNQQHKMRYCISQSPQMSQPSKSYFSATREAFKTKTSLTSIQKLKILEFMQNFQQECMEQSMISWKEDKIYTLDQLFKGGEVRLVQFCRKVSRAICDIEHHIGNQLDKLYLKKKTNLELFSAAVKHYDPFLSMIITRMENTIRKVFINTVNKFTRALSLQGPNSEGQQLKILISLQIKDGRLQCQPQAIHVKDMFNAFIDNLKMALQQMPCPTKSYLNISRPASLMRIINEKIDETHEQLHSFIGQCLALFNAKLDQTCEELNCFMSTFTAITEHVFGLTSDGRKQAQRKWSYSQFNDLALSTNELENNLSALRRKYGDAQQKHWKVNIFDIRAEDAFGRVKKRLNEGKRQVYKTLLDKIVKDNQKIEKTINALDQRLECNPSNILQMLSLQKLVREQVNEEMEKVSIKLREIPNKIKVLETIEPLDYRDYQACNRIFLFPLRLKEKRAEVKRQLENTYRKRFGQELNRDAGRILQTTRECGEELIECLKIDTLTEMCDKFMQFSNLHDKIERGLKEAEQLNDRETAMNWNKTEFLKLKIMSGDFTPHYSLITLAKNYQLHLQLLAAGPFREIDHQKLHDQLSQAKREIEKVKSQLSKNPKMLRVVNEVQLNYSDFSDHLPLIKVLRNPDLRERHWSTIRQIISIDPLEERVSLQNLLQLGVKGHLEQLQEISSIASRELVYERKLIKLKREWKEIRLLFAAEGEGIKTVANLKQLREIVEADIFQIQEMLSANFIKFLQSQILCWRNQVLYRAYELLQRWERVQTDVLLVAAIFTKPRVKEQLPGEYIRFQILEKAWRLLCNQIQSQPWLADTLQGRAFDSLGALSNSIERMKKHLYDYFEDKKREYARLACLSDDQFVILLSCDVTDTSQNAIFEQTVRKCFQNIRTLVRNERQQIIKITTRAYEQIPFEDMELDCMEKIVECVLPSEVIMDLEKRIQKELKSSLERIIKNPHNHTAQILLLYQRLNFTLRLEEQIINNHYITKDFLHQMQGYRDQLVNSLLESPLVLKNQCQLLQALYHLQITETLESLSVLTLDSFHWISQPRTYLRNNQYTVEVGLLTDAYGFQIIDLDNLITEEWSARVFCNYAGAIRERGFCIVRGNCTAGKTASIQKLAALFGHKEYVLDSNPIVSTRNLLQYLRMAASGIWVILGNLQRLTRPQLSIMARNLQVFWTNHILRPRQAFNVEGSGITLKTSYLKAFATMDCTFQKSGCETLLETTYIKNYFRVVNLPQINIQFIVNAKLLVMGLDCKEAARICAIVQYLKQVLGLHSQYFKGYSNIYLIIKLFEKIYFLQKREETLWGQSIIDFAMVNMISCVVEEQSIKSKILQSLSDNFSLNAQQIETKASDQNRDEFQKAEYRYNRHLLQTYTKLIEAVQTHFMTILVAPHDTGKSALINMLVRNNYIQLKFVCPNAYQTHELYGNDLLNGVVACLIEEVLAQLKTDNSKRRGLAFDGELGLWVQPLTTIMSSGHIIQPNGNTLLIQQEIKLLFECRTVSKAAPNLLLNAAIIIIDQPLKWQNIFTWHIRTQLHPKYRQPNFIKFLELFIPFIVDPLLQFYQNTLEQLKVNQRNSYISPSCLILSLLRLYQSLLDYYFLGHIEDVNQIDCSDSFNIFVMALVWTIGAIFPEESHKSFSRNFKYLISRALQSNIQGVNIQTLPTAQQDLYKIFYHKRRWQEWNDALLHPLASTNKNWQLVARKTEDVGLAFILQRYLEKNHSVFLLGQPATQRSTFFSEIIQGLSGEVYNSRRIAFGPNSQSSHLKAQIIQQMAKQKYSYNFNGFVHGKKTLFSIWDVNLPMVKHSCTDSVSAHEFIRHYFITKGWYLYDSPQHYTFQNIIFCGTVNIRHSLPLCLLKYVNVLYRTEKQDLSQGISRVLMKSPLREIKCNLVSLINNLHLVVTRQLNTVAFLSFQSSDAFKIALCLLRMGAADKLQVLRRWIFLSEKIYQQKLESDQSERLFYLINNVLMEQQKIRYKSIKPNPSEYHTYYPNHEFEYHNLSSLKIKIQSLCKQAIGRQVENYSNKPHQQQSKMDEFVSDCLHVNLEEYHQRLFSKNKNEADLKPSHAKLVAHLVNTFQMQASFVVSLSLDDQTEKSSSLDLQQCLQIATLTRKAKLVNIKLGQERWKSPNLVSWRGIMLGVIQQILSAIERNETLSEVIIFLDDLKDENDYILDDLIIMKRLSILPFSPDVQKMMQYFLQNSTKDNLQERKTTQIQSRRNKDYDRNGKIKGQEDAYEQERKDRQRSLKSLQDIVLSKIKAVVNIREQNIAEAKINTIYKCYNDSLREFSILNMLYFAQSNLDTSKQWSNDIRPSCVSIKSNMIITEVVNKQQEHENEKTIKEVSMPQISLKEVQGDILESVSVKMISRYHLEQEQRWLRGRSTDLKQLYFSIRERISKLCKDKLQTISQSLSKIKMIEQFRQGLLQKQKWQQQKEQDIYEQYKQSRKQKIQRQMEYETCRINNQSIQTHLAALKRQKYELDLEYQSSIIKVKNQFNIQKQRLNECLKNARDKKIIPLNNQFKVYLEAFGVLINKKIKNDEEMYKEIIKDINTDVGNSKTLKKVSKILSETYFNIPEKTMTKIRQLVKFSEQRMIEKPGRPLQREKEESFLEKFIKTFKSYFHSLIQFYSKTQHKDVKQCVRRLQQNQQTQTKVKQAQTQNIQNVQYKVMTEKYHCAKQNLIILQKQIAERNQKKIIRQYIIGKLQALFGLKHLLKTTCALHQAGCTFFCWIKISLQQEQEAVKAINAALQSYAFTISMNLYYNLKDKNKQFQEIMEEVKQDNLTGETTEIKFIDQQLKNLIILNGQTKTQSHDQIDVKSLEQQIDLSTARFLQLQKEMQQLSVLSLIQFVPGTIVLGLEGGLLETQTMNRNQNEQIGLINRIRSLYSQYNISVPDLLERVRHRSKLADEKICRPSGVLSDKCLAKPTHSLEAQQKICMLQIVNGEQLNNILKLIKCEQIGNDATIIIVTGSESIKNPKNVLVLKLNSEDTTQLQKRIQGMINVQKKESSEVTMEQAASQSLQRAQRLKLHARYLIDIFVLSDLQLLQNILEGETAMQQLDDMVKFTHEERNRYEGASKHKLGEAEQNQLKGFSRWIKLAAVFLKKGMQALTEESPIVKVKGEKKMMNLQYQKIARYLVRIYQLISFFQANQRLPSHLSTAKFIGIVKDIFQNEAETSVNKRNAHVIKIINSFRIITWNHIACLYVGSYMILFVIFVFADDLDCADYSNRQLCQLIELCFQNYEEGTARQNIVRLKSNKTSEMVDLFIRKDSGPEDNKMRKDQYYEQGIEMTNLFKKQLQKLQLLQKQKRIRSSIQEYKKQWHQFFCSMDASTVQIPEKLLVGNRLLLLYFLTLIRPGQSLQWLKKLDKQHYLSRQKGNRSPNTARALQETSCLGTWSSFENILNYMYSHMKIKESLLINVKINQIVQICINNKIPFVHLDFTTLFSNIEKNIEKSRLEDKYSEMDSNQHRRQIQEKQEQRILDDMRTSMKSESWIIINLNHCKLVGMSCKNYFKRINSLIENVNSSKHELRPTNAHDRSTESTCFKKKIVKTTNSIDISLYKYMIIYLMDFQESTDPSPENKERQEIINHFTHSSKQYIYLQHQHSHFREQILRYYISNFNTIFYSDMAKSKKAIKEYQKLSFSRKKVIYQYIRISHAIIHQISLKSRQSEQQIDVDYISELFSKIYGCVNIIKNADNFDLTEEQELSLKKIKINPNKFMTNRQGISDDTRRPTVLAKIEEYITVLLEYTFSLNYKVSALGARIHATYQYIATIRSALQHRSNYDLEFIMLHQNVSDCPIALQPISLFDDTQRLHLDLICDGFQPQGFNFDLEQPKPMLSLKEKEQSVFDKFMQQNNAWDYRSKMREASLLYEKSVDFIKSAIQMFKLFNLKEIYEQYRGLSTQMEDVLCRCDVKLLNRPPPKLLKSKSVNAIVAAALTEILTIQDTPTNRGKMKYEMLQFEKYLVRFLILLRNRISSFCLFLQQVRDVIKDYFDLEFISLAQPSHEDSLAESSDDEENTRRKQEEQLRYLIKKRVFIKNSVDLLMRKLSNLHCKMFNPAEPNRKELSLKEIHNICALLVMTKQYIPNIKIDVERNTNNYNLYQKQCQTNKLNIESSPYSQFNPDDFQFSLQTHRIVEIIQLIKIIHSKKYNQEIHHLKYSLRLCHQKIKRDKQSRVYFTGFSLVNAVMKHRNDSIQLEPALGHIQACGQMMIEATIHQDPQICSQSSIDEPQSGYVWHSFPLYIRDFDNMIQIRERVELQIKQLQEPLLLRSNIYLINY